MKKRIWELDALRGLCILGVVAVHLVYDLVELYGILSWDYPQLFILVRDWGGLIFLVLSGICVTLGRHCVRRGSLVFLSGMVCTLVTWGMYHFGFADKGIIIYFGVLHCLGCCMLLWPVFKKLPWWALTAAGAGLVWLGLWLQNNLLVEHMWLVPLGIRCYGFVSSDYFPLIFNLGFFLMGAALGKTLYRKKTTCFPKVNDRSPLVRFFTIVGSWSLPIYLLHQPVLAGVCMLIITFRG